MQDRRLPDSYDLLVPKERLQHGRHNVRRVAPSAQLRQSIEKTGLTDALVVRPVGDDQYAVTDGWQRYQAAVELGWDELPVSVYDDTLDALEAAEAESIVREWTTYQTARHVEALYEELSGGGETLDEQTMEIVAERTARTFRTVRRYLLALSIPDRVRPLLKERQNITEQEWQAAANYKADVRRYDGLSWQVAAVAGEHRDELSTDRLRRVLLRTLEYDAEMGKKIVTEAVESPEASLQAVEFRLSGGDSREGWLRVPQTGIKMSEEKKEAVMDHCHQRRIHMSEIVEQQMLDFADRVARDETALSQWVDDDE